VIGKIILNDFGLGAMFLAIATAAAIFIYWDLNRRGWASVME